MSLRQRYGRLTGLLAALVLIALFCRLGLWQWQRMAQKQAMLAEVAQVLAEKSAQPLSLAADPARAGAYDWVAGRGHFLPFAPWILDNQQRDGRVGVRVFALFAAEGLAMPVLVELGWLPLDAQRKPESAIRLPAGEVEMAGLLLPPPSPGLLRGQAQTRAEGHWVLALEMEAIAAAAGQAAIAPRILRPAPSLPLGYRRDLDVLPNTLPAQKHLGYSVQWFALAAAVLVTTLILFLRRKKHD